MTLRADSLIRARLDDAWQEGTSISAWLYNRKAGWISPKGEYYALEPGQRHEDWAGQIVRPRALRDVYASMPPEKTKRSSTVHDELLRRGWIKKLDHDQYVFQKAKDVAPLPRHQFEARVVQHFDAHHPHHSSFDVMIEDPDTGKDKTVHFYRHPTTKTIHRLPDDPKKAKT